MVTDWPASAEPALDDNVIVPSDETLTLSEPTKSLGTETETVPAGVETSTTFPAVSTAEDVLYGSACTAT